MTNAICGAKMVSTQNAKEVSDTDLSKMNSPVAESVKRIIREKGLKQKYVAEKCGMTDDTFSRMLSGKALIKPCYIPIMADALGVSPSELFEP